MYFFWVSLQLSKKMLCKIQCLQVNVISHFTEWPDPRPMLWLPYVTCAGQRSVSIPPHVWKGFCGNDLRWQLLPELTQKHQTSLLLLIDGIFSHASFLRALSFWLSAHMYAILQVLTGRQEHCLGRSSKLSCLGATLHTAGAAVWQLAAQRWIPWIFRHISSSRL